MGEITITPEMQAAHDARVVEVRDAIRAARYVFGTVGQHELGPVTTDGAWFVVEREDSTAFYGHWRTGHWPEGEVTFPKAQYWYEATTADKDWMAERVGTGAYGWTV